jgi:ArsR family transcriptional regulator
MYSPPLPQRGGIPARRRDRPHTRTNVPSPAHIRSTLQTLAAPPEELRAVAAYHKALSDPTRLRIMQRLAEGPATVTELTSHVDLSQPLVSFHLHRLKSAGVVETRRAGREVICTLSVDVLTHFRAREREILGLAS